MRLLQFFARTLKGIYDILATYLLGWVLLLAAVAFGFQWLLEASAHAAGFDSAATWWRKLAEAVGPDAVVWVRLVAFCALHAALLYAFRRPLGALQARLERVFDAVAAAFDRLTDRRSALRAVGHLLFSSVVTLLLVPFVLQPTLVPDYATGSSWVARAANLADGTASRFVADSVVGLYRRLYAEPAHAEGGITDAQVDATAPPSSPLTEPAPKTEPVIPPAPSGEQPLMDRWDPHIRAATDGDPDRFAMVKAFMWVESAGRQFAVSHTGCSGLMQFCAGTARSRPFRKVFGVGAVYTCKCKGACRIDRATRRGLETGTLTPDAAADAFPCDATDARFDPDRSIRAGTLYVDRLHRRFGGNIYLMYIGYNSGPAVAATVYDRLGRNPNATLADIELHLTAAMRPHYGKGSRHRARSLLRTHLPKIKRAYDKYSTRPAHAALP